MPTSSSAGASGTLTPSWARMLRSGLRLSLAQRGTMSGWRIAPRRGRLRLSIDHQGRRHQLDTSIEWAADQADTIRSLVLDLHALVMDGQSPDTALAAIINPAPSTGEAIDAAAIITAFRADKLRGGVIKPSTWEKDYSRRMALIQALLEGDATTPRELFDGLADRYADSPGSRGRQVVIQYAAALLRWAVDHGHLSAEWAPPLDLGPYVGRRPDTRAITTPIEVGHILEVVESIKDPRWRLAFQMLAAYGLRPEELQHLERRGGRLWTTYRKRSSRGATEPRPLRLLPCDEWAAAWGIEGRWRPQLMPPMRPGYGAEALGLHLRRRRRWQALRQEYEAMGEKLVLYSARHGYAHRAHVVLNLPPKVVAAAMGHSLETHLAAYSRWCGDDTVDAAFRQAGQTYQGAEGG